MFVVDTPTKAAQCGRPNTRHWSDLMAAAREDEEEAKRLREELTRYLERADKFSARRAARRANKPSPRTAPRASVPADPVAPKSSPAPKSSLAIAADDVEIADWSAKSGVQLLTTLQSKQAKWTDRVSALRAIRAKSGPLSSTMTAAIGVQLGDLRSRIVAEASDTIIARASDAGEKDAIILFEAAVAGVSVKKAVMADARENAALGAVRHAMTSDCVWDLLDTLVRNNAAERARAVSVRAVAQWAGMNNMPSIRDKRIAAIVGVALADRAAAVRDAARALVLLFTKTHGQARMDALRDAVPVAVRGRLPGEKSKKASPVQDMIRARKLALKAQFAARNADDANHHSATAVGVDTGFREPADATDSRSAARPGTKAGLRERSANSTEGAPVQEKKRVRTNARRAFVGKENLA